MGQGAAKATVTEEKSAPPAPKSDGTPAPSTSADASVTADSGSGSGSSLKTIGLITSGAVALVGAGVGVGFHFAQKSAEDDAKSLTADVKSTLGPNGCYNQPDATACSDLKDANDRASRDRTISNRRQRRGRRRVRHEQEPERRGVSRQ